MLGSVVELSPDLVNAYTKHLEAGNSLPYIFGTFAAVQHTIADPSNFSLNQSRAFSRLNTILVTFHNQDLHDRREIVNFVGKTPGLNPLTQAQDNLETYIAVGPTRYPHYPTTKMAVHRMFYLSARGRLNRTLIHKGPLSRRIA